MGILVGLSGQGNDAIKAIRIFANNIYLFSTVSLRPNYSLLFMQFYEKLLKITTIKIPDFIFINNFLK